MGNPNKMNNKTPDAIILHSDLNESDILMCVTDGPDNVIITGPKSIHTGDFTMLYCSAKSVPPEKAMWMFEGKPTNVNGAVYILPSVRLSDSGTYSCTAVNAATERNQTVSHTLTVVGM